MCLKAGPGVIKALLQERVEEVKQRDLERQEAFACTACLKEI